MTAAPAAAPAPPPARRPRKQPRAAARPPAAGVRLKPAPVTLAADATLDDAMAAIFAAAREHWLVNTPAALAGEDIEGVHQVRVGLRRFRSALSLFKRYLPAAQREWLKGEARWLLSELGPVRDLDVFAVELLPPVAIRRQMRTVRTLSDAVRPARALAHGKAAAALDSARARRFLSRLEVWLAGRGWRSAGEAKDPRTATAQSFALRALNKRLVKILARGKRIDHLPVPELHQLRIAVKKVRYGIEFFHDVLPKRRAARLAETLKNLQDSLGRLNDLDVAREIAAQLTAAADNAKAAADIAAGGSLVVDHHRKLADDAVHGIAPRWRAVRKCGLL